MMIRPYFVNSGLLYRLGQNKVQIPLILVVADAAGVLAGTPAKMQRGVAVKTGPNLDRDGFSQTGPGFFLCACLNNQRHRQLRGRGYWLCCHLF
jgi:hypothetical protein